jgi:hypothetical protein
MHHDHFKYKEKNILTKINKNISFKKDFVIKISSKSYHKNEFTMLFLMII